MNIQTNFSDQFIPICDCGECENMVIDPMGRTFCLKCKRFPSLQAIALNELEAKQPKMVDGFFQYIIPNNVMEGMRALKDRYTTLEEQDTLGSFFITDNPRTNTSNGGDSSGPRLLQDDTEGQQPD